jgi:hypothetical protein
VDSQPPYASYIPSENTLILGRNLALSFTSFELESPLTIRTFGHDVILAGNQLDSVHIDTSHSHSASGSIYVFTESESEPTFRVDGAPGEAGQDGDCSTQPRRCVPVSDRTTRIESPSPTVEWKESTLRRSIEWNDPLLSENFRKDLISKTQPFNRSYGESDLCQNADYAILYEQKQEFSGRLELIQTLKIPISFTNTASESTRNAKLFAGTNGSHGQNSGRVIILKLGTENNAFKFPIPGGLGGKGGRNFKTAALKRLQPFKAESKVISEQIGLANLKVNTLLQGRCGGQIGRQPLPSRAEFTHSLNSETVNMSFGFKLSNDSISLESHNEGIDLPLGTREFGTDGRSGQNGLFERRVYASRDDWESLMPINLIYPNMQKP